jgi:uncharacterized protein (TIGR02996 family)
MRSNRSEESGFLQAILEAPDEDAPRLIYADWLDEHGEALRAEFIRLHCRLAQLTVANPEPFQPGGEVISSNILRPEVRDRLLRPLLELGLPHVTQGQGSLYWSGCHALFRRGLVEGLEVFQTEHVAVLGLCSAEVFRRTPLRHLRLTVWWESSERPGNAPIRRALQTLAALPGVRNLRTLSASGFALDDPTARALLASPHFGPEVKLLFDQHVCSDGVRDALHERFGNLIQLEEEVPF